MENWQTLTAFFPVAVETGAENHLAIFLKIHAATEEPREFMF